MAKRWKPNVTVAAVIEQQGRYLLVEEDTADGLRLNTPAGHLDRGESPVQGCVRETLEETAHHFTPTALVGIYRWYYQPADATFLRFCFSGNVLGVADSPLDKEILALHWLTPAELRQKSSMHRSPLVQQCLDDYLAGNNFPLTVMSRSYG